MGWVVFRHLTAPAVDMAWTHVDWWFQFASQELVALLRRTYVGGCFIYVSKCLPRAPGVEMHMWSSILRCGDAVLRRMTLFKGLRWTTWKVERVGNEDPWKGFFGTTPPYFCQSWLVAAKRPTCCEGWDLLGNFLENIGSKMAININMFFPLNLEVMGMDDCILSSFRLPDSFRRLIFSLSGEWWAFFPDMTENKELRNCRMFT